LACQYFWLNALLVFLQAGSEQNSWRWRLRGSGTKIRLPIKTFALGVLVFHAKQHRLQSNASSPLKKPFDLKKRGFLTGC